MTYNDVLSDIFNLLDKHKMIKTWGYGPISELVDPVNKELTDYPYAFLQPTNHTLGKNQTSYRFNLIMMEMCNDTTTEIIQAQSNAQQYIKDVLGHLYYNYNEQYDFNLNFSLIPFQEKYDDTVSGMTAQIELIVRDSLNDCIAPFEPTEPIVDGQLVATLYSKTDSVVLEFPFNPASLDFDDRDRWVYDTDYFNPKGNSANEFRLADGTYSFVLSGEWMSKDPGMYFTANGFNDGNYQTVIAYSDYTDTTPLTLGFSQFDDRLIASGYTWTNGPDPRNPGFTMIRILGIDVYYATMYSDLKLQIYKTA
jgi:hypothetical protein